MPAVRMPPTGHRGKEVVRAVDGGAVHRTVVDVGHSEEIG
jgi:hypothetical protein